MNSEQKIASMQERVRLWLKSTESNGHTGTLAGLEADIQALEGELKALFPAGQKGEDTWVTLKEQAMFRTVLESMIEGVIVVDMQGQPLVFNAAARELLGQDETDSGPEGWSEQYGLVHADSKTLLRSEEQPLARAIAGESVDDEELIVRRRGQREDVHISASARPLWTGNGEQLGGVMVFHDITRSKRVEKVLREATNRAEEASRIKSEFLANMSHEIRTPLTAVLGFADLLLDPGLGESDRLNYIQAVRRNGQHLLGLINDVLDLSKLQADKVQVERADFSLHQLLHEVVSVMQVRAHEKGLHFNVVYDTPIPICIHNDAMRIRQILFNLISNAIKFTHRGSVTLRCRCLDPGTEASRLELAVCDTGIGMSEEEIEELFKPFQQANLSTSRKYGGTGLGLAICRALIKVLGGEIQVESRLGEGSVFRLVMQQPVDVDAEMVAEHFLHPDDHETETLLSNVSEELSGRILLAEDGLDNQLLISTILRRQGLEVDIAGDGEQAVDRALQALYDEQPYDLILMDMQMPRLDGYGAAAKLRLKGYAGPIVALTAHAMAGERERCIAAGCDDYLTKPISRSILFAAVQSYLQRARDGDLPPVESAALSTETPNTEKPIHSTYASDPEMQELVEGFVERLPAFVQDIQAAYDGGDTDALRRLAHQLKGSAGGYGFLPVSQVAATLEAAALQPESANELGSAMTQLTQTCARVQRVSQE
ncbi:ATP-binding protein [Marinimicrobium sp. ABcell2]|uniref:ATP-binding protein n=1 Tax=Marinimicrobium sp. ABcell2 TaxID=3069751 RepID=UPI0027B36736|nr:ATP-binding protein [Marinimicrobium sp. ABcell2]MDQ2077659.1 ATP-binding protein [Marinimicrobium sp. ABcell2]